MWVHQSQGQMFPVMLGMEVHSLTEVHRAMCSRRGLIAKPQAAFALEHCNTSHFKFLGVLAKHVWKN